jgi:protocatechuate 3,4-dioxygenase beta subunit
MKMARRKILCSAMMALAFFYASHMAHADLVKGKVLDPDGKAVPHARVFIGTGDGWTTKWQMLRADENGAWQIELEAATEDSFGRALAISEKPNMTLAPAYKTLDQSENILQLQRGQSIAGRVLDGSDQPVPNARVRLEGAYRPHGDAGGFKQFFWLRGSPLEDEYSVLTDAAGHFSIGGVPEGTRANLCLDDAHLVRIRRSFAIGENALLKARPRATIVGRVVDKNGAPVSGILVYARPQEMHSDTEIATTDAAGHYELTGLATGAFTIYAAQHNERIALPLEGVAVREGETSRAADLVFTSGALVMGQVLDENGMPVFRAQVGASRMPQAGIGHSVRTDREGRYRLRVAPGAVVVSLWEAPSEFLLPRQKTTFDLSEGATQTFDFRLKHGAVLEGSVADENGRPVSKLQLKFIPKTLTQNDYQFWNAAAVADEKGAWKVVGLVPGEYSLEASGPWIVVAPRDVAVAENNPALAVKVSAAATATRSGHVVSRNGKPLAGVRVEYKISVPEGMSTFSMQPLSAVSDASGKFVLEGVREDRPLSFSNARKEKWQYARGGEVDAHTGELAEIVMDARDATLRGRVLDAQKNPVAKARVTTLGIEPVVETRTDANGNFSLPDLPRGYVDLLFAASQGFYANEFIGDGARVTVTLVPPSTPPTRERGLDLLENIYVASAGTYFQDRSSLRRELERLDPSRAARLEATAEREDDWSVMAQTQRLARHDPAKALEWAPAKMETVTGSYAQIEGWSELAVAAMKLDHERALQFYGRAKAALDALPIPASDETDWNTLYNYANQLGFVARAAAALDRPETDELIRQTLSVKMPQRGRYDEGLAPLLIEGLTVVAPARAEKILATLPEENKVNALQRMMSALVSDGISRAQIERDGLPAPRLAAAERVLERLAKLDQNGFSLGRATRLLMKAIGKHDAARVLKLARSLKQPDQSARALALAADYQDEKTALRLRREAFDVAWSTWQSGMLAARLAALIWEQSPEDGSELFARLEQRIEDARSDHDNGTIYDGQIVETAFYLARFDRMKARIWLEDEWSRLQRAPDQSLADWQRRSLYPAMAAVDWDRAWQWSQQLTNDKGEPDWNAIYAAQRRLAEWAVLSEDQRKTARFDDWNLSDDDEEYSRD